MSQWRSPVEKRKPLDVGAAAGIGIGTRTEGLSTGTVSVIDLGASESAVIVAVLDCEYVTVANARRGQFAKRLDDWK